MTDIFSLANRKEENLFLTTIKMKKQKEILSEQNANGIIPDVGHSYHSEDINGTIIKKGDKVKFHDLIWNGFGSVSYPVREGVVIEKEIEGTKELCIDYSLGNYERIAFFSGSHTGYMKTEVIG